VDSRYCPTALLPYSSTPLSEAPLGVRVLDPACGSGHFLLAVALRIATRLARARTGGLASPADYRLREQAASAQG
jgi:hypothetical protein